MHPFYPGRMLQRFFQRIHLKALDPSQRAVTIAAFGDSVTQGVMEHRLLDGAGVYHQRLQRKLEAFYPTTSFSVINAGVSGSGITGSLERLERDVIVAQPDLVLIAFGLNDCIAGEEGRAGFGESLARAIAELRAKTEADIALLTPPFMASRHSVAVVHPDHEGFAPVIIGRFNDGSLAAYAEEIRCVAVAEEVLLVDIFSEWERLKAQGVDTNLWLCNGLNHPDARGHELAATLLFHALLEKRPRA